MTPAESFAWLPPLLGGSLDILPFYSEMQKHIPKGGRFLEVGSFLGRSLSFMGALRPDIDLNVCDPWEGEFDTSLISPESKLFCDGHGGLYEAFRMLMLEHAPEVLARLTIVRERSDPGLKQFGDASMDFMFIDGDHHYPAVIHDCKEAVRIVKPGGIIAGHDYCFQNEVTQGVNSFFGQDNIKLASWPSPHEGWNQNHSSCWWVQR
jgi:SAM-dependent methyltransferase